MAHYQPTQQDVALAVNLLNEASNPTGDGRDKLAMQQLEGLKTTPQFCACVAYVFAHEPNPANFGARCQAGLLLKNNMRNPSCATHPVVVECVQRALDDPQDLIRRAAATAVSSAVGSGNWPTSVVANVLQGLRRDPNAVVGALTAIRNLCEDCIPLLGSTGVTAQIIPAVIPYLDQGQPAALRKLTLQAVSALLEEASLNVESVTYGTMRAYVANVGGYLLQLATAQDVDEITTCYAVRSLILLLSFHDLLGNSFQSILDVMCQKSMDSREKVRKEAVEFWGAVLNFPAFAEKIIGLLPQVIQVLLQCMVYTQWELALLQKTQNDWNQPDKPEDVKPQKYSVRHKSLSEEDGDDDDDEVLEDSCRANAGLALDKCAEFFGDKILTTVLAAVDEKMRSSRWEETEAAVMAVGAIADGCFEGMRPYLGHFVKRLLELLEDENSYFLVKCIALWVIGRYSSWFGMEDGAASGLLSHCVAAVTKRMVSPTKRLQEAAVACLGIMADSLENQELEPYTLNIVKTVTDCFAGYQLKNRYLLFETVNSLAHHLGQRLGRDDCLNTLMQPLMTLWGQTPDDSPMLYPYFRCMSGVCSALGSLILPMAQPIFQRSFNLISYHVQARAVIKTNPQATIPEDEFLVTALDLLSGLSEALQGSMESLISSAQPHFTQVLGMCLVDPSTAARQAALAVVGDLCTAMPVFVQQLLPNLDPIFLAALRDPENCTGECSNAAWVLHDLACNQIFAENLPCLGPQHVDRYLPPLVAAMNRRVGEGMESMAQNCALAIGRFLYLDPAAVSRNTSIPLASWIVAWFELMAHVRTDYYGKEPAVRGMLAVLMQQPATGVPALKAILDTATSFRQPTVELSRDFGLFFQGMAQGMGAQWTTFLASYDRLKRPLLRTHYGVQ
jgi:transportin-2